MSRYSPIITFLLLTSPAWAQEPGVAPRTDAYGDPLPAGALRRLGTVRFRQQYVHDMAFTPEGKTLVVAGSGQVVQWDVATGKPLRAISTSQEGDRFSLGLSRDGRHVAFRPDFNTIVVAELATGIERFRKKVGQFPGGVLSPDNNTIAIGTREGSGLWDLKTGEQGAKLPGIHDLKYSSDGKWLAGWSRSRPEEPILVFDAQTGAEKCSFKHPEFVKNRDFLVMITYGFTPDGRSLAVSWVNAGIMLYDLKTQKLVRHIDIDAQFHAISPDGKVIVANKNRTIILLNLDTGKEIRRWEMSDTPLSQSYGAFSPDGKNLAIGFEGGIQLWNPETGRRLDRFLESVHIPQYLAVSNDAKTIAVLYGRHAGQFLQVFDAETLKEKARIDSTPFTLEHLAFSPDGRRVAFVECPIVNPGIQAPQTRILDVSSGKETTVTKKIAGYFSHWKGSDTVVVSPGLGQHGSWVTVEVATGQERSRAPIPNDIGRYFFLSSATEPRHMVVANERRPGTPDDDGRMFLAEWPSGKRIRPLVFYQAGANERHSGTMRDVRGFSPDGRLVLTSRFSGAQSPVTFSEAATGRTRFQIAPENPKGYDVHASYSPDGRLIVVSGDDTHTIMDALTLEPLMEWVPKTGYASSFAFSANGQIMVTGDTSAITVWDLKAALRPRKLSPDKLSAADLAKLWTELENTDAQLGHCAMVTLYRRPDDAITFLKSKLPTSWPEKATFDRLVRDLDDANFKKREAALNAIVKMGDHAGAMIREAMKDAPSLETKRRLAVLAEKLTVTEAVRIRWLRCIELLERIGTPSARAVLEQFRNVSDAETADDAKRSLDRLALIAR